MANKIFVDTSGWANLFVATESYHSLATEWFSQAIREGREMVTTNYVLTELVALLNSPLRIPRPQLFQYVDAVKTASYVTVVHIDGAMDAAAWFLLKSRSDKSWSLVDATSFLVMRQLGILESLTSDRHFEQAGFIRLLK